MAAPRHSMRLRTEEIEAARHSFAFSWEQVTYHPLLHLAMARSVLFAQLKRVVVSTRLYKIMLCKRAGGEDDFKNTSKGLNQ